MGMGDNRIPPKTPNIAPTGAVTGADAARPAAPAGGSDLGLTASQRSELNRILGAPAPQGGPRAAAAYLVSIGHPVAKAAASYDSRYGTSFVDFVGQTADSRI